MSFRLFFFSRFCDPASGGRAVVPNSVCIGFPFFFFFFSFFSRLRIPIMFLLTCPPHTNSYHACMALWIVVAANVVVVVVIILVVVVVVVVAVVARAHYYFCDYHYY